MKPLALAICITTIATLLVGACGCTSNTSAHSQLLTGLVDYDKKNDDPLSFNVTWVNDTCVLVHMTQGDTNGMIITSDYRYTEFPNTENASQYFFLESLHYPAGSVQYYGIIGTDQITGNTPSVAKTIQSNVTHTYPNQYLAQEDTVVMEMMQTSHYA